MFSGPLEGLLRAAGTVSEQQLCSEGSTGGNRLYTLNRRRAKKLIPVYTLRTTIGLKGTVSSTVIPLMSVNSLT